MSDGVMQAAIEASTCRLFTWCVLFPPHPAPLGQGERTQVVRHRAPDPAGHVQQTRRLGAAQRMGETAPPPPRARRTCSVGAYFRQSSASEYSHPSATLGSLLLPSPVSLVLPSSRASAIYHSQPSATLVSLVLRLTVSLVLH